VQAFGRNLFDKAYETEVGYTVSSGLTGLPYTSPAVTYAYKTAAFGPPRTYGLMFQFNF
jgi:outer membrane receptor protein involved in Fe transport